MCFSAEALETKTTVFTCGSVRSFWPTAYSCACVAVLAK